MLASLVAGIPTLFDDRFKTNNDAIHHRLMVEGVKISGMQS
jgi:hypothetical protein